MPVRFFNTLSRRQEEFVPLQSGKAGVYVCGPTVYAPPHIGNLRTFTFADVLHRYLEFRGFEVRFVMNLTDVDDKTITGALRAGVSLAEYTAPFVESFFRDLDALGIARADVNPRATEHVEGMVRLIERLQERGMAYVAEGSVYFDISEFPGYGKLSGVDLEASRQGERVADDEYDKDDVRDFALWKAGKPEDEAVGAAWDTPWGRGRPGWHIECSAMSMEELGETFDIHAGGVDLVFPHHEDEIAQSEGATGQPFARYWLHGEHLLVDGEKMSKSLGNFYTLADLLQRKAVPSAIRYVFLTTHYRGKLNFTWDALSAAAESVRRVRNARERIRTRPAVFDPGPEDNPFLQDSAAQALGDFARAMDDDLNTSIALSVVHRLAREVNVRLDGLCERPISQAEQTLTLDAFERMDGVLRFLSLADEEAQFEMSEELAAWIEERVQQREAAREARDYTSADRLRDELAERGVTIEDTPKGPRWILST